MSPHPPRIEPLEPRRLLSTGDIDPAFNNGKPLTEDYHHGGSEADFLAPLPNGGFLTLGSEQIGPSFVTGKQLGFNDTYGVVVTKYTFDGTPDSTFGNGGSLLLEPADYFHLYGLFPTPDGGFIVDGSINVGGEETQIVKYTPDGQIDTTFGKSGILQTGNLFDAVGNNGDLTLDSAGRILVSGADGNTGILRRYLSDGQLDSTFANNREFDINPPAATEPKEFNADIINSIAIDSQNRIIVGITQSLYKKTKIDPFESQTLLTTLARLSPSGAVDASFNATGTSQLFDSFTDTFFVDRILSNGNIVLSDGENVVEFNPDGSIDKNFGQQGYSGPQLSDGLAIAPDGSMISPLISGSLNYTDPSAFILRRIKSNGTLDRSFGTNGRLQITSIIPTPFTGLGDPAVAFAPDGTLLVASNVGMLTASGKTDTRTVTLTRLFMSDTPAIQLIPRTYTSSAKPLTFNLLIRDPAGIDTTSLTNSNLRLFDTDNNSSPITFRSSQDILDDDDTYLLATYRINNAATQTNGAYTLHLMRHQISNTSNNFTAAQNLGAIRINIP